MGNSNLLFETLFKEPATGMETSAYLLELTEEYPYFTAAQFFLLQKTGISNTLYPARAAKTAVLFNNPYWLNYQLNEINPAENDLREAGIPLKSTTIEAAKNIDEGAFTANLDKPEVDTFIAEALVPDNSTNKVIADSVEDKNALVDSKNIESIEVPAIISIIQNNHSEEQINHHIIEEIIEDKNVISPLSSITEINISDNKSPFILPTPFNNNHTDNNSGDYEEEEEEEIDQADELEIEPMNIRLNFTPDIATTEETISFEPLHTSDYFASLGIKLNEDGKPVDKLGRQLKSFTEWLKTMKKIHTDQLQASTEQTDIIIQKMAEKSNAEGDILTEAMAEVLMHQGKLRKAVELYQKLSLLNPGKSAYFAAKIEQIAR